MGVSFKEQLKALATKIGQKLSNKIEINGDYSDTSTTVGNARQLISNVGITEKVPYNFRTSGGSDDIGNRMDDKIVGGTIVWNQLQQIKDTFSKSGITFTRIDDGTVTLSGTAEEIISDSSIGSQTKLTLPVGHKIIYGITNPTDGVKWYDPWRTSSTQSREGLLMVNTTETLQNYGARWLIEEGTVLNNVIIHFVMFDLTQMLGADIADYIYQIERSNSGEGISRFRSLFPKTHYAYNAGELMSVCTNAHITRGFNAWDEEWEVGTINYLTGQNSSANDRIRSKNYIPCLPNTIYHFTMPYQFASGLFFYDADKNYIPGSVIYPNPGQNKTTPENARYMRFVEHSNYGTEYKNDICINISWSGYRNGEYESYVEHIYPLSAIELRGIPKLDANNNIYYDGDTYAFDGTVTRYYASRDYQSGDESLENAITDGTTTVYKLETPTIETANPFTDPQSVDDFGTEEYVDALATAETNPRDVSVPVGHETFYQANLRDKLQNLPENANADGLYLVKQMGNKQELIAYTPESELPTIQTEGTYTLKSVNGTLTWVAE